MQKKDNIRVEQHYAEARYADGPIKNSLPKGMKERRIITRLCNHIQDLPGVKVRAGDPEYNALVEVISDEEAKIALKMKVRKHYSAAYLAKKAGYKSKEDILPLLENMAYVGLITATPDDDLVELDEEGKMQIGYEIPIFVPGIMENIVANVKLVEEHPIIARAFSDYTIKRIIPLAGNLPVGGGVMRVIPIESAIKDDDVHKESELISHYIEKYDDICVSPCSCRVSRRLMNEGCGHLEEDMCIQFGRPARSFIKSGRGRRISKKEAYEILEKAEKNGLMHEMPNTDGDGETHAMCNCCGCSCFSLRCGEYFHTASLVRSNYVSTVDPNKCVACGECVEVCPMNALKLGERLKTNTPTNITQPLDSYDYSWKSDKWNPDYRFDREYVNKEMGTAPCKLACPAHIAIEGYLELAKEGRYQEALELIKHKNPLPAICGRVCNKKCEDACTRGKIDEAVSIDEIKKAVSMSELDEKSRIIPEIKHPEYKDHKMAIIGSGPAGLSAAYYLAEMGYSVTVFEKENKLGGMLTLGIPSFRLEKDVIDAEIDIIRQMGVEFKTGIEVGKDVTLASLREEGYGAFFLAVGAQGARKLNVPGEELDGIISGVDFLKQINLGKKEKLSGKVVVMGGGNVAIDVARTAIRQGASSVDLYCLESREEMNAAKEEIEEAINERILIHNGWGVKEFLGKDKLEKAILKKCVSVFDEEHRFNPTYDEESIMEVGCDTFIAAIGQAFEYGDLLNDSKVVVNNGRIEADPLTLQTAEPDVFVGGDCFHGTRFAIDAIANGKEAAESMHRFVHPGQSLLIGRSQSPYELAYSLNKDNINVQGFDNARRVEPKKVPLKDLMKDNRIVLNEEEVKKEAGRCLKCGRTFVDETMCVGCGLCTTRCKFDAIHLVKKFDKYGKPYEKITANAIPHILKRNMKVIFTGQGKGKRVDKDKLDTYKNIKLR